MGRGDKSRADAVDGRPSTAATTGDRVENAGAADDRRVHAVADLRDNVGHEVALRGWVRNFRSSGKIAFVILRDGTGEVQCVFPFDGVSERAWELVTERISYEASVRITGEVRADVRAPGGFEVTARDAQLLGPSEDYPIQPKGHGVDFLLDHRHLWLRHPRPVAIMKVRDEVIRAIRDFFHERGFTLIDTPILTGSIGESAGTLFETEYFDLGQAYLAQTGQLYLEAAAAALANVYCFGPTFRAEKSKTRRHLTEFWMVEAEVAWLDSEGNMRLQEDFICHVVSRVLTNRRAELEELGRDLGRLEAIRPPFDRTSYDDAVAHVRERGKEIEWGEDLGGEAETILTAGREKPLFVYDYPKAAKAFYMKEHPEDTSKVRCNDLLAPEGYGEIIGGSQREDDHDKLLARIGEEGLPEDAYAWYLDLRKYGTFPHSGFGLGVERTVSWICGLDHLREAIPFPRMIHRIYP